MLDQRRRRRADVVQMLYKCFVFAGIFNMRPLLGIPTNLPHVSTENKCVIRTLDCACIGFVIYYENAFLISVSMS